MPVNKWLYEEWKVCTQITVTQQTQITVRHLSYFAEPVTVVSVKISSHNATSTSNLFKFHFLWKTYSLVSYDFCNLSATRVVVKDIW